MSGIFLSFDGIDGCGKSTQISLLESWLAKRGFKFLSVRDPGGTELGESVRELLLHQTDISISAESEMLLYMASRAQLVQERILPALKQGLVVISDRYLLANVVYQSCGSELETDLIWGVGKIATRGLQPEHTFLLDIDAASAGERLGAELDRLESRGVAYMESVRQAFLIEVSKLNASYAVLDAKQPVDELHEQIIGVVSQLLDARGD